ncbi:MAG: isoprenylcysteine carboxylmethyltransferase family protein [Bacteroidetes bacterium]|nr:MAG: isoprenylcysteine carboxylmethyltransferase family protein [Bacteroidota bacterium]
MTETAIRIIFALLFFTVLAYGGYHRHRAHRQNDSFRRMENEGTATFLLLRCIGGALWLTGLLFPFAPAWFDAVRLPFPEPVRWGGILFAAAALPMGYSLFRNIGRNITDTVETRAEHELVTTGIYRYIRHPLYTTGFLFFSGLGLLSGVWPMLLLSSAVLYLLHRRTETEERFLLQRFGQRYEEYRATTGRFFPNIFTH